MRFTDSMIRLDKKQMLDSLYASIMCKQHDLLVLCDSKLDTIRTLRVIRERLYDDIFNDRGWELRACMSQGFIEIGPTRIRVMQAPHDTVSTHKFRGLRFNNVILYGCPRIRDDIFSILESLIR